MLPKKFKPILWEYNLEKLNLESDIVVERLLNFADKDLTDYWIKKLGKQKAKELFIKNASKLNKKSYNYWSIIFNYKPKLQNKQSIYEQFNTAIFQRSFG